MPETGFLLARPSYRRHLSTAPGETTAVTATAATAEVRAHLALDSRARRIEAAEDGAVVLRDGDAGIHLAPCADTLPRYLSAGMADQLLAVGAPGARARLTYERARGLVVIAGTHRIPPAATNRLVRHGYLAAGPLDHRGGVPVAVSLAGVIALEWRHARATGVPAAEWPAVFAEAVADRFAPED
ncbi:hypothetical protein [Streptomyces collinus]